MSCNVRLVHLILTFEVKAAKMLELGISDLMANRFKVLRHLYDLTSKTNNFAFEFKVTTGLEGTCSNSYEPKIWFNGPQD